MSEQKEKATEKEQKPQTPAEAKKDELSEKDLEKSSGGWWRDGW